MENLANDKNKLAGTLFLGSSALFYIGFQLLAAQNYTKLILPIGLILFASFIMALSLATLNEKFGPMVNPWIDKLSEKISLQPVQIGMLLLSVPLTIAVRAAAGDGEKMLEPAIAVLAWLAAISLAIFSGWKNEQALKAPSRKIVSTFLGIFLLAFLVRIIFPNTIPVFLTGDEGSSGIAAASFANGESDNLFKTGWYAFPSFYFAIPGILIRIFGQDVLALRMSSAIPGALTVVCVFWLLKTAYDSYTAWTGALFLSFLHFHVHFSRIGLNNIWDGLWFTIIVGALWYAWTRERRNAYLLGGLALGLSQYFYSSGRILVVLAMIWLAMAALHDRARLKRSIVGIFFFWLVSAIVVIPLVLFYMDYPSEISAPLNRVTILGEWLTFNMQDRHLPAWRILLEQFGLGFGAYTFVPLRHWYRPEVPILRAFPAIFFMIGLVFLFFVKQKKLSLMLLLWLCAFATIGALSESTPASQRYPASAPAVAMLVAIGLNETAKFLRTIWPKAERVIKYSVMIITLLMAANEAYFYFFKFTPKNAIDSALDNSMVGYRMGLYLRQRQDHPQVYFLGSPAMGFYSIPSTQYLAPKFNDGIDINYPWGDLQNPPIEGDHLLFFILPFLQGDLDAIRAEYPGGTTLVHRSTNDEPLYYIYEYNRTP